MDLSGRNALRSRVLDTARAVAQASGGILRMGATSTEERNVLKRIEDALAA